MPTQNARFIFRTYLVDPEKAEVSFFYDLFHNNVTHNFVETLIFPQPFPKADTASLASFLQSLFLMLGISYWKTYCPAEIIINGFSLTKEQAAFWNTVYTKGLGEFFYKNQIDFRGLIQFPYKENSEVKPLPVSPKKERALLPVGGGKDAIVAAELLKMQGKDFTPLLIYTGTKSTIAQEEVVTRIGKGSLLIKRTIDKKLLELNKKPGVLNGHVPMVGLHSFICLLSAYLYDYKYIILGNEESANHGNVMFHGEIVNHQWSKSLEFEELFQTYVKKYVSEDILYFSILRSFSEIKIAQLFSSYPQYFSSFVSCNKGYAMKEKGKTHWCGKCPKCAFVFALLAAYLPKQEVVTIFGKNLFADTTLLPLYKELLGIEAFKPFECVGTPSEMHLALLLAYEKKEWQDDAVMAFFEKEVLPTLPERKVLEEKLYKVHMHHIPEAFTDIITHI